MTFSNKITLVCMAVGILPAAMVFAGGIPPDQVDSGQIYYGQASSFENPAEVDIETVIASTPEYQEIQKKKIDHGTGKYWILYGQATNRALKAISDVADESDYDLIAESSYLGSLEEPIASVDITELVVSKVTED